MSLFEELKRRNVFKVGVAYAVIAWLVLQVTDIVLNNVKAPGWVFFVILLLLVVGFLFALFFAWAFELTPEGIKRENEVDRSQSIAPQTGKKLNHMITVVLALALAYFAYDKFVVSAGRERAATEPAVQTAEKEAGSQASSESAADENAVAAVTAPDKSIAVLPFINMSSDAEQDYFSDGISEEILNALAQVHKLKVAGRTSSFAFKGRNDDLRTIGKTLGVTHILEGSVRKAGDRVRITAQLIKVDDGFHMWSETYDRQLTDIFAIQDEISTAILTELKAALLDGSEPPVSVARTDSKAYDLYLLAKQRMYERTELKLKSAADLLDKAIAIDPDYAPAYAQRGITALLLSEASYGKIPQDQARVQAKLYLDKGLSLDENLAEALAGLGLYYNGPPSEPAKGIPALKKALAINPNLINASNWLVLNYWFVNRATDAMALLDEIAERDPLYRPGIGNRVFQMALMGRGDEARAFLDKLEPFFAGDPNIIGNRAWIDFEEGKTVTGLKRMQTALAMQATDRVYKVGVNQGLYLTHQYEQVTDDHWSGFYIGSLFNLGRNEEGTLAAQKMAAGGTVAPLFALLNATDQSPALIDYLENHWPDLEAFQQAVPPSIFGYREMADIALAYRRAGRQARFDEAMKMLAAAQKATLSQGIKNNDVLILMAAYHAMAGDSGQALQFLARAVDGGLITSAKISREYPYFRELDGNPDYEAIQARMLEHLNREREQLGLEPVST